MSDILIKGMEMPKSCEQCKMFNLVKSINDFRCCANDEWHEADFDYHNKRHPDCPIVEVLTPHGRLIDADKFLKWLQEFYPNSVAIMSGVKNAKTIIEAEV